MSSSAMNWSVAPRAEDAHLKAFSDLPPLLVQLLYNRGIHTPAAIDAFLNTVPISHDPFLLSDMQLAVARIMQAVQHRQAMVVYGDYDADGVTSTTLLTQALQALGGQVKAYIPNRFSEGYGLNKTAIAALAEAGTELIITVDCGIRSGHEVAYANSLGLDMIVSDHHSIPHDATGADVLPPALAVINPKRQTNAYPFADLAGVGVAYKLAQALRQSAPLQLQTNPQLSDQNLLDLVAIGTVADLVPLVDENRSLVQQGLIHLNNPQRVGLLALIDQSKLRLGELDAESIGFGLGPRINAAGRLDDANIAYQLLTTSNIFEAEHAAQQLQDLNQTRRQLTQDYINWARNAIAAEADTPPLYLVANPDFNEGVVGLVASRLTDDLYRPALVAKMGNTHTRGSARSIPEFDITAALDACGDLLVKYGGHAAAAGFTVANQNLPALKDRLLTLAHRQLDGLALKPTLAIDAKLNLRAVKQALFDALSEMQPFGYGNPRPLFLSRGLVVQHTKLIGSDRSHLRLVLFDGKQTWTAIAFRMGEKWQGLQQGAVVDVVYTLEQNTWRGATTLQLNLKDMALQGH